MRRILAAALAAAFTIGAAPSSTGASYLSNVHWRMIGPFRGGRALAVTGVPGQPDHFYFGAVDGGVWESFDTGRTWKPIFDAADIGSIGSIAVAPSSPNVVYVGSGEADMRSDIAYGNGMYVSNDAGKTWTHGGLEDSRQIGAVVVDPHQREDRIRSGARASIRTERTARRFQDRRRRRDVEQSPVQRCEYRRGLARDGSAESERPLRGAVANAPAAVERLSSLKWPGQRAV